uniref:Ankyrin repeat domain 33Bb n=1 Tax=Sphaeramia orbicularis TaxID=375764 RepID=A0A673B078_9TELE
MSITRINEEGEECEVSEEDENDVEVPYTREYWEDEDDIYQEFEELDFDSLPDRTDTRSVASDDSFYPPDSSVSSCLYRSPSPDSPEPISFYKACCNNNAIIVKIMIRQGMTEEEVKETDRNRRSGLIMACYYGYVDVVMALSQCPYLDVNWQDNEGNTALITAAQLVAISVWRVCFSALLKFMCTRWQSRWRYNGREITGISVVCAWNWAGGWR